MPWSNQSASRGKGVNGKGSGKGKGKGKSKGGKSQNNCNSFVQTGFCSYGSSCRYQHPPGTGNSSNGNSSTTTGSGDSKRFLQKLSVAKPEHLAKQISGATSLWQQCWAEASVNFSLPNLQHLAVVLAKIPFSAHIPPPPLYSCEAALKKFLEKSSSDTGAALQTVNIALNVVVKLLQFEWEEEKDAVKDVLLNILEKASDRLQRRNKDHRDALARIDHQMDELDKDWIIKKKPVAEPQVDEDSGEFHSFD